MSFTPIERKAAFVATCTLKGLTKSPIAKPMFGVSWQHLNLVLLDEREGSAELKGKIADFVGVPASQFWRKPVAVAV